MLNWNNTMEDSNLVLIVDEDPETIRILGHVLSPPWQIQTAADSEEAASALRDRSPCVAVMNLDLPGMGGMNLLWLLRQVRPRTRIIVPHRRNLIERRDSCNSRTCVRLFQQASCSSGGGRNDRPGRRCRPLGRRYRGALGATGMDQSAPALQTADSRPPAPVLSGIEDGCLRTGAGRCCNGFSGDAVERDRARRALRPKSNGQGIVLPSDQCGRVSDSGSWGGFLLFGAASSGSLESCGRASGPPAVSQRTRAPRGWIWYPVRPKTGRRGDRCRSRWRADLRAVSCA